LCSAGLAMFGLAALAKDPLGAILPPLAIGVATALAGRARPVSAWLPWPGIVACLVIGFGWWIGAELRTPGFGWYTTIDNHARHPREDRRGAPAIADRRLPAARAGVPGGGGRRPLAGGDRGRRPPLVARAPPGGARSRRDRVGGAGHLGARRARHHRALAVPA